ncbi:MAG: hypothetical protein WCY47_03400 [Pusillimonas sp.]
MKNDRALRCWPQPCRCRGQALAEGVVILLALIGLWVCATWLFRLQDMALQTTHAARFSAFSAARGDDVTHIEHKVRQHFFRGPAHQWRTLPGRQWLSAARDEVVTTRQVWPLPDFSGQPGAGAPGVRPLLADWSVSDNRMVTGQVAVQPRPLPAGIAPLLVRRQSILVGAGHGKHDGDVLHRLGQSSTGWASSANASRASGQALAGVLQPLDAGWGRANVRFDWLDPWSGEVPGRYLQPPVGGYQ